MCVRMCACVCAGAYLEEIAPLSVAKHMTPTFFYYYYLRQEDYDYATESSKILL